VETPLEAASHTPQARAGNRDSASAGAGPAVSPVAQRVLASALRERADRRSGPLSARDLLLALLREPNGGASRTLERLGVSREELKLELARE
jgi:ATP-dependent Clp protease ATP-binding subunit ClpA